MSLTTHSVSPPVRGRDCLPALELEELAATGGTAPHLDGCASCKGYVDALKVEIAAYAKARPFELFEKKLERRPAPAPRRWWLLAVPAAVAATLAAVVLALPHDQGRRDKRSPLTVHLHRNGAEAVVVGPDQRVAAGDTLKISFDAPHAGHLLVLNLDGREHAVTAFPLGKERSAMVVEGPQVLDGSLELDDSPGPEWLVAVFSETPLEAAPLLAQLKGQSLKPALTLSCDGCRWYALRLKKE